MAHRTVSRVRRNVCLILIALLFLSWGYFILSFTRDYQTIEQQNMHNLESLAVGLESHTEQIFDLIDTLLLEMLRHFSHHSPLELQELFSGWLIHFPALAGLAIVDTDSGELFFSLNERDIPEIFIDNAAFSSSAVNGALQLSEQLFEGSDGRHQMALARSFQQGGRRLRVVALLYADFFLQFHQEVELGQNGSVAIFHESGVLFARKPHGERLVGRSFAKGVLFRDILPESPVGVSRAPKATDGIGRLVAHRKLTRLPLVVTVGASIDRVFSRWEKRLLNFLVVQIVISMAIMASLITQFRSLSQVEKIEIDLEKREEHFRAVANSSVDAVISVNATERVRFWSAGAEQIFGCAAAEAIGMPITCFLQFAEKEQALTLKQLSSADSPWSLLRTIDVQGQRKDGELFPTELSVSSGLVSGKVLYTLIVRDVTERKQMEERIRRMASHDNLTGLPNRGLLMDRLQVSMAQVRRQGGQFALLFLDLDQFKPVNDTLGHETGDQLLQQVAKRMLETVRASDTVARVGGDEFALLLLNAEDETAVRSACDHLLTTLRREFTLNGKQISISCSIGVALYSGKEQSASELIGRADSAMYAAKRAGKNRFSFAD